jgi:hypothetical protein
VAAANSHRRLHQLRIKMPAYSSSPNSFFLTASMFKVTLIDSPPSSIAASVLPSSASRINFLNVRGRS